MKNQEYLDLISTINHHNYLYFTKASPEITDTEYDKLYFKIEEYEKQHPDKINKNSPTQRIGDEPVDEQKKIKHPFKLLSLQKANTFEQVTHFTDKFNKKDVYQTDDYMIQLKEDGLTIALYYNWFDNKQFVAATRGRGTEGEDCSKAMDLFKNKKVPKQPLAIRGEVILTNKQFEKYNQENNYTSPRNTIAGIIRKDEPLTDITFIAYNIENAEDLNISTQQEMLKQLKLWGFETPQLQKIIPANQPEKINNFIENFIKNNTRQTIDHEIDGLVIKPTNISNRNEYGFTGHHPRGQLAFKFESPEQTTILTDVTWQIGSTGRLTPVGHFKPINLLGAKIQKATLSNYGVIKNKDIRINDQVLVKRSNDVIPYIVKSYPEKRTGNEQIIEIPKNTHFEGAYLISNKVSDEQLINQWSKFVSDKGLNITQLSKQNITQLSSEKLIDLNDFTSLWNLPNIKDTLLALDHWSNTKTENLLNQLILPKELPFANIIASLSIPRVGLNTATEITKSYPTIDSLKNNQPVIPLPNRWLKPLENIIDNLDIIENILLKSNLKINQKQTKTSNELMNQTFVITGKSEKYTRKEIQKVIEEKGGHISNTVTSKTTFLIDLSPGVHSTKTTKAENLNIPIKTSLNDII